ncbi:MAG TPA: hypothetical protein VFY13_08760, partial [Luteolibacter sp.]|nr:hypothetical protein [Luteolibacter sp.]
MMKNCITKTCLSHGMPGISSRLPASTRRACLVTGLLATWAVASSFASATEFRSNFLSLALSDKAPAFTEFSVDSLGQGKLANNPVLKEDKVIAGLQLDGQAYKLNGQPVWNVAWSERELTLKSDFAKGVEAPPFQLAFKQKLNHATLLGMMEPEGQIMKLPCVLHLPDMGTLRIMGQGR